MLWSHDHSLVRRAYTATSGIVTTMSLFDELEQQPQPSRSKISQIISGELQPAQGGRGLTDEEREELHDLLVNPKYRTASIHRLLKGRGFTIGETSVRRYREQHSS